MTTPVALTTGRRVPRSAAARAVPASETIASGSGDGGVVFAGQGPAQLADGRPQGRRRGVVAVRADEAPDVGTLQQLVD